MSPNPFLGVFFHWLGGLAAGSFYLPYRKVQRWSWETYWLVGGFFSWLIAPWILASILVPNLMTVLKTATPHTLFWAYFFGAMWGLGGLTFGLTMRYLGIALGMAVALGYTAAFGTLMPPIFHGTIGQIASTSSGKIVLFGVAVCLAGIGVSALAGMSKEKELTSEEKKATVTEFNFGRGMLVATFSGIMSSSIAFGFDAATPVTKAAQHMLISHGGSDIWDGLPRLIIVLAGGFTTNFIWCVFLNIRNRSGGEYFGKSNVVDGKLPDSEYAEVSASEAVSPWNTDSVATSHATATRPAPLASRLPLVTNYVFSALAGLTWYMQFFFYSMGQTKMGKYDFSSWTLHMSSIIIFSTLWGIALHEWRGSSSKTKALVATGLAVLIGSTIIIGYGNYLTPAQ